MEEKVKTFLDEGYDFIEESCSTEPLSFTDFDETIISEAQTAKSPFKIIGRLAGKFAPVGGFSRNNRYYPESHWKTVLESAEVQRRLKGREMLGMIGHEDSKVGDFQIREGLISHVVSCLEIREDNNGKQYLYGEMDILDTPAGRILKAMHEGGAGLYVSSRAAGKLMDTPGKPYKTVSPQFFLETWDVVARPGFMEAKPVFEQIERQQPQPTIHESDTSVSATVPITTTSSSSWAVSTSAIAPTVAESKEVEALKDQVSKLTKIIEKVVDDVYEENEVPVVEQLTELLDNPEISESAYEDVISILKESKPELVNAIMENSRKKFNAEHGEKSGLEIEHYRFAGKHPYKVVPKGTDYFAASHDSPTFRTLKQAQKHVLDSYNKPKVDKNEALVEAIARMAVMDISEETFDLAVDMLKKGIH